MRRHKSRSLLTAALAAFALAYQSAAAAPGTDRAIEIAARRAFNLENRIERRQERLLRLDRSGAENKILRLQNRLGIETATSIQTMQAQLSAQRAAGRLSGLHVHGLPQDLDLRSRRELYSLPSLTGNVAITRGDEEYIVDSGTKLTAAEVAAVYQVLQGEQILSIGRKGNAAGGSLSLDTDAVNSLSALNIPRYVTVIGNFTSVNELAIAGDLHNAGSLLVRTDDPSISSATITASSIRNARSGSIGTLDSGSSTLDLNLKALNEIVNYGSIRGNGNISLTAGGAILNVSEPGNTEIAPTITAGKNLSLQSASITNSGVISATTGNITIADRLQPDSGAVPQLISVYARGGTFSAHGDITVGNNNFAESDTIVLTGGDYHSNKLIVNAGAGTADGIIGDVTGELKVSAGAAHLGVSTANLSIGRSVITGDPTFFNDAGSITITDDLVFGEAIAILASGDVTDGGIARNILARSGSDVGQPVTIIAGASLKALGGATPNPNAEAEIRSRRAHRSAQEKHRRRAAPCCWLTQPSQLRV